jgi:hypothetical protein
MVRRSAGDVPATTTATDNRTTEATGEAEANETAVEETTTEEA